MISIRSNVHKNIVVLIIYSLIAFIVFGSVLNNGFSLDDYGFVYKVPVKGFTLDHGFFRPLSHYSTYLNYLIFEFNAFSYHFINVLLHVVCCWLIWLFTKRVFEILTLPKVDLSAFFAGLFFLIYPFHSESIFWITARGASIATMLALASMIVFF